MMINNCKKYVKGEFYIAEIAWFELFFESRARIRFLLDGRIRNWIWIRFFLEGKIRIRVNPTQFHNPAFEYFAYPRSDKVKLYLNMNN